MQPKEERLTELVTLCRNCPKTCYCRK